jgi:hypothetical protein
MQLFQNGSQGPATVPTKQPAIGTPGFANSGQPGTVSPTIWDHDLANTVIAEIVNVVAAAGITLDSTNNAQLLAAIRELVAGGPDGAGAVTSVNTRTGAVTLVFGDITSALGFTPSPILFSTTNDVTLSRTLGTIYTNTIGRPIFVSCECLSTGPGGNLVLNVNGISVFTFGQPGNASETSVCGVVPAGQEYQIAANGAGMTLQRWVEMY